MVDYNKYGKLRKHQTEACELAKRVIAGAFERKILLSSVTPGGGKTLLSAIFAHELLHAGVVDRVCWVSPRRSLSEQAVAGFHDLGRSLEFKLRLASNKPPLVRDQNLGTVGYSTTYQSISSRPEVHAAEFLAHKYLLILDEIHHLREQTTWRIAMHPLVDMATAKGFTLALSGTILRHDRHLVPFIHYTTDSPPEPICDIEYSRADALKEKAVLPVYFELQDGVATYAERGQRTTVTLSSADEAETSKALMTALNSDEYRNALIKRGMDHFLDTRAHRSPKSKCIIICDKIEMADKVEEYLRAFRVQVAKAVSNADDPDGQIRAFKRANGPQVLVTCNMAHEGLDIPSATHVILLTTIRSWPWIVQAIARVTRMDYASGRRYEDQYAYVFCPDDPKMVSIVETMNEEQKACHPPPPRAPQRPGPQVGTTRSIVVPLDATATGVRPAIDGLVYTPEQAAIIEEYGPQFPGVPAPQLVTIIESRDREHRERSLVQLEASARDERLGLKPGTTNRFLFQRFGKSREKMGLVELRDVSEFLNQLRAQESPAAE